MKKTIQSILTLMIIASVFSSCAALNKTKSVDYDYMYISKQGIIQRPLVTDLEVAKEKQKLTRTYRDVSVAQAKENIMGEFIQQFSCDLIVQPYFITSSDGTALVKTNVEVTVNGYPASYKNIRMYEPKDSANFKLRAYINNYENKPITNEVEVAPKKKKNIGWIAVLGAAVVGVLLGLG
jgi:hypothetical protein